MLTIYCSAALDTDFAYNFEKSKDFNDLEKAKYFKEHILKLKQLYVKLSEAWVSKGRYGQWSNISITEPHAGQ